MKDGVAKDVSTGESSGIGIRVLDVGWGYASTNEARDITALADRALAMAKKAKRNVKFVAGSAVVDEVALKAKRNPQDVDAADKKEILRSALDAVKDFKEIASTSFSYFDSRVEVEYRNSEGSEIKTSYPRVGVFSTIFAKKNGKIQVGSERLGATGGLEALDGIEDSARSAAEKAMMLLEAKEAPKGRFQVVLDPKLTGVFVHEALGHAVEADHIIQGESILEGKTGEEIASDIVSVYDDPTLEGSFGFYRYDSEGVAAVRKFLVERGVLVNYLHSRETASELGAEPTGNARSMGYSHPPIVRMSNTYLKPGDFEFEEIIDIDKGVYLKGSKGGEVDTARGVFQFSAEEGFLIEKGEITTPIRDVALSGRTLDILKKVDAVGKDFGVHIGFCGKAAQTVPVGDGGPHLRTRATVGGTAQ